MDIIDPVIDFLRPFKDALLILLGAFVAIIGSSIQSYLNRRLEIGREGREHYRDLIRIFIEQRDQREEGEKQRLSEIAAIVASLPDNPRSLKRPFFTNYTHQRLEEVVAALGLRDRNLIQDLSGVNPGVANYTLCTHAINVISATLRSRYLPAKPEALVAIQGVTDEYLELTFGEETPTPYASPTTARIMTQLKSMLGSGGDSNTDSNEANLSWWRRLWAFSPWKK